ncbi:MAG: hypothetical protein RLZZ210_1750 [Pseudomonadota bacterium]|jgi:UPF0176 protein
MEHNQNIKSTEINQIQDNNILNISTYKFVELSQEFLSELKQTIHAKCEELSLKGTVILATEGINIFLAGSTQSIHDFFTWFNQFNQFSDVQPKESMSSQVPFRRLIVKIKPEIITMRMPVIRPQEERAPAVEPKTLARWLRQGHDDNNRPVVMLDTRNDFEVQVGTFDNAINYHITKFTEFTDAVAQNKKDLEDKTVVSFCTGGIRCEKAAIYMQNIGLDNVYQLEGGILKYFEEAGGEHYTGECFVFDYRTALNPKLEVTGQLQCYGCRAVVTVEDQQSSLYQPPLKCPHCAVDRDKISLAKEERVKAKISRKMQAREEYKKQQKSLHANK